MKNGKINKYLQWRDEGRRSVKPPGQAAVETSQKKQYCMMYLLLSQNSNIRISCVSVSGSSHIDAENLWHPASDLIDLQYSAIWLVAMIKKFCDCMFTSLSDVEVLWKTRGHHHVRYLWFLIYILVIFVYRRQRVKAPCTTP